MVLKKQENMRMISWLSRSSITLQDLTLAMVSKIKTLFL